MGHQLCSHLDILLPDIADKVQYNQSFQKQTHEYHAKDQQLQRVDLILVKNYGQGPPWIPGNTLKHSGAVTFVVKLIDETIIHHHLDQLKLNMTDQTQFENEPSTSSDVSIPGHIPSSEVTTPELRHSRHPPSHFSPDQY